MIDVRPKVSEGNVLVDELTDDLDVTHLQLVQVVLL